MKEERAMKDVFSLKICPVLGAVEQGGELVSDVLEHYMVAVM